MFFLSCILPRIKICPIRADNHSWILLTPFIKFLHFPEWIPPGLLPRVKNYLTPLSFHRRMITITVSLAENFWSLYTLTQLSINHYEEGWANTHEDVATVMQNSYQPALRVSNNCPDGIRINWQYICKVIQKPGCQRYGLVRSLSQQCRLMLSITSAGLYFFVCSSQAILRIRWSWFPANMQSGKQLFRR